MVMIQPLRNILKATGEKYKMKKRTNRKRKKNNWSYIQQRRFGYLQGFLDGDGGGNA
jgi:hypothetical protein